MEEAPAKAFHNQKKQALEAVDLSRKGSIDLPIQDLIGFINKEEDIYSTSSCSGRIIVFSEGSEKKRGCLWIHVAHEKVDEEDLVSQLMAQDLETHGVITFKFEPFVLHCQCRTMQMAQAMLKCALDAGFRNSGLVIGKKKRIIMAVRSTHGMEVPIAFEGKLAVSEEYLRRIVKMANVQLEENLRRIERFFSAIKMQLGKSS